MKLREIYKGILKEIGDSIQPPPNGQYKVSTHGGSVYFNFLDDKFQIDIRLPVVQSNKMALGVDFTTESSGFNMTNKGQPLKVMSYVTGGIEKWLQKYSQQELDGGEIELVYIKFNAKGEDDELDRYDSNRRNKLYQYYLTKFAKQYNASVQFDFTNGTTARFQPHLKIK